MRGKVVVPLTSSGTPSAGYTLTLGDREGHGRRSPTTCRPGSAQGSGCTLTGGTTATQREVRPGRPAPTRSAPAPRRVARSRAGRRPLQSPFRDRQAADRPPLRHPHPTDRGDARRDGAAPRSATTSTARTRRCCALEERVAGLFGHEAALFTPTGSMANVLAVGSLVAPGPGGAVRVLGAHRARRARRARRRSAGSPCAPGPTRVARPTCAAIRSMFAPDMGPFFVPHRGDLGREHPQLRRRRGAAARRPAGAARRGRPASGPASTSTAPGSGTRTSRPASRSRSTAPIADGARRSACPRGSALRSAR